MYFITVTNYTHIFHHFTLNFFFSWKIINSCFRNIVNNVTNFSMMSENIISKEFTKYKSFKK